MFPDLEAALGCKLPSPTELHTEEARQALDRCRPLSICYCGRSGIMEPNSRSRLIDDQKFKKILLRN
jgi:hypothetical protein